MIRKNRNHVSGIIGSPHVSPGVLKAAVSEPQIVMGSTSTCSPGRETVAVGLWFGA
jgi:hypothetical protein